MGEADRKAECLLQHTECIQPLTHMCRQIRKESASERSTVWTKLTQVFMAEPGPKSQSLSLLRAY